MGTTTNNAVHLTVDVVLIAERHENLRVPHVLLIERDSEPYAGSWALPGGYVDAGELIEAAAPRELAEETGLTVPGVLRRVGVYDEPGRDPRGRVISHAFGAVLHRSVPPVAGSDARKAQWTPLVDALSGGLPLAFDHFQILSDANRELN